MQTRARLACLAIALGAPAVPAQAPSSGIERSWPVERGLLLQRIAELRTSIAERRDALEPKGSPARLAKRTADLHASRTFLLERIPKLERRLRKLLPRLPDATRKRIQPLADLLPPDPPKAPFSAQRHATVAALVNEISKATARKARPKPDHRPRHDARGVRLARALALRWIQQLEDELAALRRRKVVEGEGAPHRPHALAQHIEQLQGDCDYTSKLFADLVRRIQRRLPSRGAENLRTRTRLALLAADARLPQLELLTRQLLAIEAVMARLEQQAPPDKR